jgi:hypothetical protein
MEVKFAFFCDAATIDGIGKLNVLGIFSAINSKEFPLVFPKMTFVAAIDSHRSEVGTHKFKISFIDQDGKDLIPPLENSMEVQGAATNNFLIDLNAIAFPAPGTYSVDISMDNHHLKSVLLNVVQIN